MHILAPAPTVCKAESKKIWYGGTDNGRRLEESCLIHWTEIERNFYWVKSLRFQELFVTAAEHSPTHPDLYENHSHFLMNEK